MCGKHLNQMWNKGKITDITPSLHAPKINWSEDDVQILVNGYKSRENLADIANKLNRSTSAISAKAAELGLPDIYISKFSTKYDAPYKDYDWLKEHYIDRLMSPEEIASECGATPRVICKWCEKYKLYQLQAKRSLEINNQQRELIMFSLLGDGHIDKRETRPLFIVSHAINQKDYLFWKYDILKTLCNKEPTYYQEQQKRFGDKVYTAKPSYRLCTRVLDELLPIRNMSKSEIISQLNEFGVAIHFLDDAYRSNTSWEMCYAAFTDEEKELYRKVLKERFDIEAHLRKDMRYISFNKADSRKIDEIILRNIPNDLDIIKYKILKECVA